MMVKRSNGEILPFLALGPSFRELPNQQKLFSCLSTGLKINPRQLLIRPLVKPHRCSHLEPISLLRFTFDLIWYTELNWLKRNKAVGILQTKTLLPYLVIQGKLLLSYVRDVLERCLFHSGYKGHKGTCLFQRCRSLIEKPHNSLNSPG